MELSGCSSPECQGSDVPLSLDELGQVPQGQLSRVLWKKFLRSVSGWPDSLMFMFLCLFLTILPSCCLLLCVRVPLSQRQWPWTESSRGLWLAGPRTWKHWALPGALGQSSKQAVTLPSRFWFRTSCSPTCPPPVVQNCPLDPSPCAGKLCRLPASLGPRFLALAVGQMTVIYTSGVNEAWCLTVGALKSNEAWWLPEAGGKGLVC